MAGASTDDMLVEPTEELTHRQRTRLEQVESLPWVEKYASHDATPRFATAAWGCSHTLTPCSAGTVPRT